MDVSETPEATRIVLEVPGVARDDLDVSVAGHALTIRGRKSAGREEEGRDWHLTERRTGSFLRTVPLGFEPEGDAVAARFEDGVLIVEVRKPEAASASRRIEIA
jgi:HSP20 family protein